MTAEKKPTQEYKDLFNKIEELKAEKERLENNENTDEYDDYLNEISPEVKIGSLTYSASQVLKNVDEIAYNCGFSEYNDEKISEIDDEIEEKEEELKQLKEE